VDGGPLEGDGGGWDCSLCGRIYRTKASLYFHRSTKHRESVRKYQKY
jgi:hypothetical protein